MANQSKVYQNVLPDVSSPRVQTDSDDLFSEVVILSDDSKVHYCTGCPGCEMLRVAFKFVLGSFFGREKRAIYCKSLIIVLLKLRLNLGFLINWVCLLQLTLRDFMKY